MGYYSEIAYGVRVSDVVLNEKATEQEKNLSADGIFLVMLTEMQSDPIAGKCFDETYEINEYLTIDKEKRTIVFNPHDTLKWYDDYKDVKAHERLYEIMQEYAEHYGSEGMNSPVSSVFIRLGEDSEDIDERGSGHDPWSIMSAYRGIDVHI